MCSPQRRGYFLCSFGASGIILKAANIIEWAPIIASIKNSGRIKYRSYCMAAISVYASGDIQVFCSNSSPSALTGKSMPSSHAEPKALYHSISNPVQPILMVICRLAFNKETGEYFIQESGSSAPCMDCCQYAIQVGSSCPIAYFDDGWRVTNWHAAFARSKLSSGSRRPVRHTCSKCTTR